MRVRVRRGGDHGLWCVLALLLLLPGGALGSPASDQVPPPPLPEVPFFGRLTAADGLPDDTVRALLQDRLGFLWIGTQNGLARYDGTEMRVYRPVPGDSVGIAGRTIFGLHEDAFGCIWVSTGGVGLSRLDPRTGIFTNYSDAPAAGALPGRFVLGIASTPDSTLWLALQDGGLAFRERTNHEFQRVAAPSGNVARARSDSLTALLAARDGTVFVGIAGGGIGRYDPARRTWQLLPPRADDPSSPRPGLVNHIAQDHAGRIWFATAKGLALWNAQSESLRWYQPQPAGPSEWENYLTRIAQDASGRLWIGSPVGLYRFDPEAATFDLFRHEPRSAGSIASGPVMTVLCDRSGAIWAGGWQSGLSCLDPWRTRFSLLAHAADDRGSLDQDAVVSVLVDKVGTLWVGTGGVTGVHEVGALNRRLAGETRFTRIALGTVAPTRTVLALCEDTRGGVWIGTDRGLLWLAPGATAARPLVIPGLDNPALAGAGVYALEQDRTGALWVGSFGRGLYRIRPGHDIADHYLHDPANAHSLSQNRITRLHCDAAGRLWIGTSTAGLNLFDPKTGDFHRIQEPSSGLGTITDFEDTAGGGVYVATGAGLFVVDSESAVPRLDTACGLSDVAITSLVRDASGGLWVHTPRGLIHCDAASRQAQLFDSYYGVPAGEMYFGSCRAGSGTLYFGSKSGLLVVDPQSIRANPYVPPVVITGLLVNDEPAGTKMPGIEGRVFPFVERIVLPYDRNDLRFNFAALNLAQPERVRFRYRLQNDDRGWRTPSTQGVANYTNLPPGSYRFEVQAGTPGGDWGPTGAALEVDITPPWWRTLWARAAYWLLGIGLAALIYRLLIQRERIRTALEVERAEARHLQELDQVKSRFFANISHEFRTPLTLILGPLVHLREAARGEARTSIDMIDRNARRLEELIEQLLDLSRLEAGRVPVRWQHRDVLAWLKALVSSFDSMAKDRRITLLTEIPSESLLVWFEPDLLEKIIVNLVSNALKFTPAGGEVRVGVEVGAATHASIPYGAERSSAEGGLPARPLGIAIANTGSYIPPSDVERIFDRFHQLPEGMAAGGTGIGLALTKELVELLGGSIAVESDADRGTCFRLVLHTYETSPVGTAALGPADAALQVPPAETRTAAPMLGPDAAGVTDTQESSLLTLGDSEAEKDDESEATRPRLLVVEDNSDLRAFLASELCGHYDVLQAADGESGLATATAELPDLVLSDVIMPGLDGIELCRRLKADPRTDHIPVVLLSARTEVESRLAGLSGGADDYQAKPFDPRELRLRIRNLIEERRRLRQKYAREVVQLGPAAMPVTSAEERFVKRAREIIDSHIDDPGFGVEQLAIEIGMSKAQLLRKVRAVTGAAPRDLIRTHRLQRASHLLASGYGNVTEVAYAVGMESLSTFAKRFREQYGVAPSEYPGVVAAAPARGVEPELRA